MKGIISVTGTNKGTIRNKNAIFKNNAQFRSCIIGINNTFIDNADCLDLFMSMYYLLEESDKHSMT